MKAVPTWEKFNSDLKVSDNSAVTVDNCNTMNNVQVIVDTVEVHRRPKHLQITANTNIYHD